MRVAHIALAAGYLMAAAPATIAQTTAATRPGDTWDSIKTLPDWSGVWASATNPSGKGMQFSDAGKVQADELAKLREVNGDIPSRQKKCLLAGFPGSMTGPEQFTLEFLYAPGETLLTDSQAYVRHIYTDGRKHHKGPPTMQGDSIGHWEGQTLVVDTVGLDAGNELYYGFRGGKNMHVTERISLKDKDTLQIENTIEAPEMLSKPHHYMMEYNGHRDWTTVEMNCSQNNRSVDEEGRQTMKLLP